MSTYDHPVCSKCGEVMMLGEAHHMTASCKYEPCMQACRALREPRTLAEYQAALLHWKFHTRDQYKQEKA